MRAIKIPGSGSTYRGGLALGAVARMEGRMARASGAVRCAIRGNDAAIGSDRVTCSASRIARLDGASALKTLHPGYQISRCAQPIQCNVCRPEPLVTMRNSIELIS